MQPGLFRLGTDFGNGDADSRLFSLDSELSHYIAQKARILAAHPTRVGAITDSESARDAVVAATSLVRDWLAREGHPAASGSELGELTLGVAEDLVVVARPHGGADQVVWAHVCFPSGWRPERILGRSFLEIHARIPRFEAVARGAASLVDAMVTRGPYVRFVWTITADSALDHHPEQGHRAAWSSATARAFLRVERQTTIGLTRARAAVFLIRTYVYGFEELSTEQRRTLAEALTLMPPELLRYKGLEGAVPRALDLLR
jgi:dimethylamine monooxygenase subunit A